MKTKTETKYVGASFLDLLAIVFIVLKLTHVIEWSWWWVLSPRWISFVIVIVIVIILFILDMKI